MGVHGVRYVWMERLPRKRQRRLDLEKYGAGEGTRTPGPIITNDVLYQLSYTGAGAIIPGALGTGAAEGFE